MHETKVNPPYVVQAPRQALALAESRYSLCHLALNNWNFFAFNAESERPSLLATSRSGRRPIIRNSSADHCVGLPSSRYRLRQRAPIFCRQDSGLGRR